MTYELLGVLATIGLWLLLGTLLARYIAAVLQTREERGFDHWTDRIIGPIEKLLFKIVGVDPSSPMTWKQYAAALLLSNAIMCLFVFYGLTCMGKLPFNPSGIPSMESTLAFHTAASFIANTDLQHYAGETGVSYLGQIGLLMFLQFTSAATGLAAFVAISRAIRNRESTNVGNFYGDLVRSTTRVLLPLSAFVAVLLLIGGVPMTFQGAEQYTSLEGRSGLISRGPVAAMVAIKHLGTNGGGFFGVNSSHPFENPSYFTNMVEVISQILLPLACVLAFGFITGRKRTAVAIFVTMLTLLSIGSIAAIAAEWNGNDVAHQLGFSQPMGNLEGKEIRTGTMASGLFAAFTTATSCGAVNSMHDSFTPLGGLVPLVNMWINSIFGGDGVGFINMLLYIIITVFIAGLMVGRTPEFLGKKVEIREVKLAAIAVLVHPALILGFTAITAAVPKFSAAASNPGAHGFSQILYEFSSATANNGSGFEGLGDNTPWWNISTGVVMLAGRYIPMLAPLALAATLGTKKTIPESTGTFRTDTALFVAMLLGIIIVIGALSFLPVAVLGPISELLSQRNGL